ncbi:hypothetical protein Tco_0721837 [Tanacetum coccineum]
MFDEYFEVTRVDAPVPLATSVNAYAVPPGTSVFEDSWFESMQNEIHEFDRLEVWVLVPKPKGVMIIALKWIYKVKLDEQPKIRSFYIWNVKTALSNGDLQDEVFISQPEGFEDQG